MAADKLKEALSTARLAAPARVVYSNVTAKPHDKDVESIKAKMCEQLMAGVLWEDTMNHMRDNNSKDQVFQNVKKIILNPKAISMDEMYGYVNSSQEWFDGLASKVMRGAANE